MFTSSIRRAHATNRNQYPLLFCCQNFFSLFQDLPTGFLIKDKGRDRGAGFFPVLWSRQFLFGHHGFIIMLCGEEKSLSFMRQILFREERKKRGKREKKEQTKKWREKDGWTKYESSGRIIIETQIKHNRKWYECSKEINHVLVCLFLRPNLEYLTLFAAVFISPPIPNPTFCALTVFAPFFFHYLIHATSTSAIDCHLCLQKLLFSV